MLSIIIDRVTCFYRWKISERLKTQKSVTKIVTRERIVIDNIWLISFLFESYTKDFHKILRDYFSIEAKERYEKFCDHIRVKRRQSTKITIIFIIYIFDNVAFYNRQGLWERIRTKVSEKYYYVIVVSVIVLVLKRMYVML